MIPAVSVVLSTYNRGMFLKEAVNSVLNQTFDDFEFIITDDNSTDDSFEILKNYKDKRIRLYKNRTNCGCTFNYHNLQNLAHGKYIAHIDDDDYWDKNKLKKQVDFMQNNGDIVLLGSFIETFGENARPAWVFDVNPEKLAFLMNFYNPMCHSSIIYRKNYMEKNGINYDISKKCSQDYDFYKQIILTEGRISNLPEKLVKYRMHKKRLTDITETQKIQIEIAEKVKKELLSKFLNKMETAKIMNLMQDFPFNEYNMENVIKGITVSGEKYIKKYNKQKSIVEEVKNDILKGLYRF